jgi:uncharacterized membrane protein
MIELIYKTLESIGFNHPLHPVTTHIPMGMVIGAFLFALASFKWEEMAKTAHHCSILALVFLPITVVFGIMDWQHRLAGTVSTFITAKLILAGSIALLLALTIYLYRKGNLGTRALMVFYTLCLLNGIGLGFIGGSLVYG